MPIVVSRFVPLAQRFFPPVVTGTVVTLIGLSLIGVGFDAFAGGAVTTSVSDQPVSGPRYLSFLQGGLLADGVGCAVTSTFGVLPKTSYEQNVAVITLTRVASRQIGMVVALMQQRPHGRDDHGGASQQDPSPRRARRRCRDRHLGRARGLSRRR